jgi:hypothetical protein
VTGWTDAPLAWPLGVREGKGRVGRPALVVTPSLVKAIRTESGVALKHWFGVRTTLVWRWRKWLGVEGHTRAPGSRRLQHEVSERGAAGIKAKDWTDEELDRKSEVAKRAGIRPGDRWKDRHWTPEEDALLGTDHDRAVAGRIGRTRSAVTTRRVNSGIRAFPGAVNYWRPEELALLGTADDDVIAATPGRTENAVMQMRQRLGIPVVRDRRRPRG